MQKTSNYTLFHKPSNKDVIPLKIPELVIGTKLIKRKRYIKFLRVMIDECINWKDHMRTVENKIAKNLALIYRAKQLLNTSSLKSIYFSYIYTYLNYTNIAWASTQKTKLKMINIKQKHAARIIFNEDRLCHLRPLLKNLNALNIYQLNIYQNLNFMHRLKNIPKVFTELIKKPKHKYPTKFSENSYTTKSFSLSNMKYCISVRGPKLWNEFLQNEEKEIQSYSLFQKTAKSKFTETENKNEFCTFDIIFQISIFDSYSLNIDQSKF